MRLTNNFCFLPAWWLWREARTRSHPELGSENSQRRWYFVLRHGRVGRCQACRKQKSKPQHNVKISSPQSPAGTSVPLGSRTIRSARPVGRVTELQKNLSIDGRKNTTASLPMINITQASCRKKVLAADLAMLRITRVGCAKHSLARGGAAR